MTWSKREAVTNLVVLGDEEGHVKTVGGLLIGMPKDKTYPDKVNYEIVRKDGETVVLSGSASLSRQINSGDLGKFIKCEFNGWGRSGNGKFKIIEVNVWEGEPTEDMKKWPGYAEIHAPKKVAAAVGANDDGFGAVKAKIEADDDLPF